MQPGSDVEVGRLERVGKPVESIFKCGFGEIYTDTLRWPNFTVHCLHLASSLMVPYRFQLNSANSTAVFRTYSFHDTY